jgi:hypothetical protein
MEGKTDGQIGVVARHTNVYTRHITRTNNYMNKVSWFFVYFSKLLLLLSTHKLSLSSSSSSSSGLELDRTRIEFTIIHGIFKPQTQPRS